MPAPISDAQLDAISAAIFRGNKIEAIKLYREAAQGGLAEAKEEVERLTAQLRQTSPEHFSPAAKGAGCAGVLLVSLILVGGSSAAWVVSGAA